MGLLKVYQQLFDQIQQEEMRNYFLGLGKKGMLKEYEADEIVELSRDNLAIVIEGCLKQSLYSRSGSEKTLYFLQYGEILGEMDYFSCGKNEIMSYALERSIIAVMDRKVMEEELQKNPLAYKYFMHSITRKFRIVMLQMTGLVFNDSLGKLAEVLLRLSSQVGLEVEEGIMINFTLTHEEMASLIGCSRATVTKGLNKLKDADLIKIVNKKKG